MIGYSSEVTIARPPHAVYEALLDPLAGREVRDGEAAEALRLKALLEATPESVAPSA